ncbi:hypothetical protein ACIBCM_09690 [Streptomyces sp. NPDC051018]|uniref:hypothetical protein n=1 Tax=Streptomyces sp. NPDC051018 TaxID=3365639 RepID=UPI0037ACB274
MEIWTDGTVVVQAHEETENVRVLRDLAVVGEAKGVKDLGWKTPLAVDVDADRIWAGVRLREFRLSDLTEVASHEEVVRVAGLGGGRLAAVLPPVDGVCRLAVGTPGNWEREVVLDDLAADVLPGLQVTDEEPGSRAIGDDPTLTATEYGLVVADGRRGVVAHFSPDLRLLGLWMSGGAPEIQQIGYATARGVLVTAQWAGRHSDIGWLTSDGARHLRASYGAYALPAGTDRMWLIGDFMVSLLDHEGGILSGVPAPNGMIQAAHASGRYCVMATSSEVSVAVPDEGITVRSVRVGGLVNIVGAFDVDKDHEFPLSLVNEVSKYAVTGGYSSHVGDDGRLHVVVRDVRRGSGPKVTEALRAEGAVSVSTVTPDGGGQCCSPYA